MTVRIDGTNSTANPAITGADTDTGLQLGTNEIQFVTGGTNRATVESNGNLTIEDGNLVIASTHGIDFSDTADSSGDMANELLDDYEEGTFEPTFTTTDGDYTSVTYQADTGGRYIKIGGLVYVQGCVRCTAIDTGNRSSGSTLCVGGMPFTNAARNNGDNADPVGSCRIPVWGSGNNHPHAIQARSSAVICTLLNYQIDGITVTNTTADTNNTMMVQFTLTYTTA